MKQAEYHDPIGKSPFRAARNRADVNKAIAEYGLQVKGVIKLINKAPSRRYFVLTDENGILHGGRLYLDNVGQITIAGWKAHAEAAAVCPYAERAKELRSRLRAPIADGGYEIVDRYRKGKGRNFVDHVRVHGDYLQVAVQESLQADYLLKWFHNIDS